MAIERRELSTDRELTEEEIERIDRSEKRVELAMERKTWITVDSSFSEEWDILLLKCMNGLLEVAKLTRGGMSKDEGVDHSGEKVESSMMFMAGVDNIAHRLSIISDHMGSNIGEEAFDIMDENFVNTVNEISGNLSKCMIMGRKISDVSMESANTIQSIMGDLGYDFGIFDMDEHGIYKEFRFTKCPEGYDAGRGHDEG